VVKSGRRKGVRMLRNRRFRIAWKAYLAEKMAMRLAEHPSEAVVAERFRGYFRLRFMEAAAAPVQ
jgi:hypothetical protein